MIAGGLAGCVVVAAAGAVTGPQLLLQVAIGGLWALLIAIAGGVGS